MALRSLTLAALLAPCALASTAVAADRSVAPRVLRTHFSYTATVPATPAGSKSVEVWLPIPSDGDYQRVTNLMVSSPASYRVTTEPKFGNRMVYVKTEAGSPVNVTVSFDVERKQIDVRQGGGKKGSESDMKAYLQPDALVPVGGKFAQIGEDVVGRSRTGEEKVRAIFEHVVATMQYDYKKESPHLGEGDVAFVCDYKKGNCSDLHSYLISVARSEDVPAYLEYGFPITGIPVPDPVPQSGKIGGYHCWTWFYDDAKGWMPVDASDGRRWLDSSKPDIKDSLVGSLVLERSAVAISRGRDITLVPAQKGRALNNFIYPYAEADGKPVDAKWDLSYTVLGGGLEGGTQSQIDELRRLIDAQSKEIQSLKTGQGGQKGPAVSAPSGEKVTTYGFIRLDTIYDSQQMNPNSQTPFYVQSPDNANVKGPNDQFTIHPRLTRLGLDYSSPGQVMGWDLSGKIEIDFQGGGSESRANPRARHLYGQLKKGPAAILFGQTWDLISPLFPSPNDDTLMWNAGNLGDRRPQLRYTYDTGTFNWAVALGLTGAIDAKDLDTNGVRDGEDSGQPNLQARIGWKGQGGNALGVWGHMAKEHVTNAVGGENDFQSNSLGADFQLRLNHALDLRGEVWTGRNLSDFRGGIGQGVNTTTGDEIASKGGWAELGFQASSKHRIAVGYTVDDPENDDVPANGRTRNYAWFLHNKWSLAPNLDLGLNYLYWTTEYKGLHRGIANRFNLFISHKF